MAGSGTAHLRKDKQDLVLQVEHLVVEYPSRRGTVHAVSDVSFDLAGHETLGIVGESGCGKSTTGRAILRVPPPTSGRVLLDGVDLSTLRTEELRQSRSQLQMIFQDAISSLNRGTGSATSSATPWRSPGWSRSGGAAGSARGSGTSRG